jgi:hypothetical protein
MYKLIYTLFISCFMCSNLSFANVTCEPANIEYLDNDPSQYHYHFKAKQKCRIPSNNVQISKLAQTYYKAIIKDADYEVKSKQQQDSDYYRLDVVYTFESDKGTLKLSGPLSLIIKDQDVFSYEFSPEVIDAKGDVKYTRKTQDSVVVRDNNGAYELDIEKTVTIKKPWIAPEFIFLSEVKKGLKIDMQKVSQDHIKILSSLQ